MLLIMFRSKLVSSARFDGYSEMADEMDQLVRTMPGFIDAKAFTAEDGERLTVIWWQDEETLRAWREQARHRIAQRLGRERWYSITSWTWLTSSGATSSCARFSKLRQRPFRRTRSRLRALVRNVRLQADPKSAT